MHSIIINKYFHTKTHIIREAIMSVAHKLYYHQLGNIFHTEVFFLGKTIITRFHSKVGSLRVRNKGAENNFSI